MSWRDWFRRSELRRSPPSATVSTAGDTTFTVVTDDAHAHRDVVYPKVQFAARHEAASGEFVVPADAGAMPTTDAFAELAAAIARHPDTDYVFGDEAGPGPEPWHKPGWSPTLLLAQPYTSGLAAVRTELLARIGGPRPEFGAAALYDFALRATAAARRVVHVPKVLCRVAHARVPGQDHVRAATAAAAARGLDATVTRCEFAPVHRISVRPRQRLAITVVVPTRDRLDLLRPCIDSVLGRTRHRDFRVLIVDNGSVEAPTQQQFAVWRADPRVAVLRDDSPFDYAALMNRAVAATETPLVLLLNNDTEVIAPEWLDELAGWIEQPDVGAVGAKLYYGDGSIQHAGVLLGVGGVASHCHKNFARTAPGYHGLLHCVRDVSAVTGACMLVRRDLYLQLGGLETELRIAFNDIDFCLRLRAAGHRVLWTPLAELHHLEGKSRGRDFRGKPRFEREMAFMKARWGEQLTSDPYHNPNFSLRATDYRLR